MCLKLMVYYLHFINKNMHQYLLQLHFNPLLILIKFMINQIQDLIPTLDILE